LNSKNNKELFSFSSSRYVRCENCNLVYLNPRPNYEFIDKLYQDCKHDCVDFDIEKGFTGEKRLYFSRFSDRLNEIRIFKKRGRILDVGCAWGHFLCLAKKDGWDGYGIEPSLVEAEYAKREFGLNVFRGHLRDAKFPNQFFNVITLWHVLEHIPHPIDTMLEMRRILKDDGLLALEIPGLKRLRDDASKQKLSCSYPSIHLFYFDRATLRLLLEKAGMKILQIKECGDTELIKKIDDLKISFIKVFIIKYFGYLKWVKRFLQWIRGLLKMHKNIVVYARPL
jgi:SAM-dependent methyltransferase